MTQKEGPKEPWPGPVPRKPGELSLGQSPGSPWALSQSAVCIQAACGARCHLSRELSHEAKVSCTHCRGAAPLGQESRISFPAALAQ